MRALVTGGTGIVGANIVRALLEAGHEVCVLVRPASDRRALEGLPVALCEGDVLEPESLLAAAEGCGLLFHAAATFSYWDSGAGDQRELAQRGTRNALEAARWAGTERVVLTSSSVVLGSRTAPQELDETADFDEPSPSRYTLSKLEQERTAFRLGEELGIEVVAACPTLALGAHDHRLSPSNAYVLNYLNDPFRSTFLGGCNFVSARDVGRGHVLLAEKGLPGARYVLGAGNLTWREVHETLSDLAGTFGPALTLNNTASYLAALAEEMTARLAGSRPSVTREEARMAGRFYWYSHQRAAALGYRPEPPRAALAESLAWLMERGLFNDSVENRLRPKPEVLAARAAFAKERAA